MTAWNTGSRELSISSKVLWRSSPGHTEVRVEDADADIQRNALLDALHLWIVRAERKGDIDVMLNDPSDAVREAVGTLLAALAPGIQIRVSPAPRPVPDFAELAHGWADLLKKRDQELEPQALPTLARRLSDTVKDSSFKWTKTLHSHITGRVDGLVVCSLDTDSTGIMRIGKSEKAKRLFVEIAGAPELKMTEKTVGRDAGIIRELAESRRSGKLSEIEREHLLEARVLRGNVVVTSPDGHPMEPAIGSGQLPTRWATGGDARYLDALMRDGQDLWAVELKIRSGGAGQYLRHGVGQVVLYREFIREATPLHPYLSQSGAKPSSCRAAVAFPHLSGSDAASRTRDVEALGELFDVEVLLLDARAL